MQPPVLSQVVLVFESLVAVLAFVRPGVWKWDNCERKRGCVTKYLQLFFSPLCSYLCLVMELFLVKVLSHWSQVYTVDPDPFCCDWSPPEEDVFAFFAGGGVGEVARLSLLVSSTGCAGSIASAVGSRVTSLAWIMLSKCCLASWSMSMGGLLVSFIPGSSPSEMLAFGEKRREIQKAKTWINLQCSPPPCLPPQPQSWWPKEVDWPMD